MTSFSFTMGNSRPFSLKVASDRTVLVVKSVERVSGQLLAFGRVTPPIPAGRPRATPPFGRNSQPIFAIYGLNESLPKNKTFVRWDKRLINPNGYNSSSSAHSSTKSASLCQKGPLARKRHRRMKARACSLSLPSHGQWIGENDRSLCAYCS